MVVCGKQFFKVQEGVDTDDCVVFKMNCRLTRNCQTKGDL